MNHTITIVGWAGLFITLYFLVYWIIYFFENMGKISKELNQRISLKNYPLFSVIIPIWNESKTIEKTLKSIMISHYPKDKLQIIVVNDGSTDDSKKIVEQFMIKNNYYNITLINHSTNKGKGVALNTGLKKVKGELFACLDADSFIGKKTIKRMVYWHQKNPDTAIMTPVMKIHNPKSYIQKFQRLEYMAGMLLTKLMSYMDCNYVAPGPFSVYKTKIIKKMGGFDEKNLVEDQEIAYRAQKNNYKIKQCPKGYVYTIGPPTLKLFGKQRNRWYKGTILNILKYRKIIFNRKYGDFGLFQLPLNILAYFLAAISLTIFIYFLLKPISQHLKNLYLVGFDIIPYIKTMSFDIDIFGMQINILLIIYFMMFLSVVFLFFASRSTQERVRTYGTLYIIPYFFVYFIMVSFIMVQVVFELLFKKKQQKW